MQKHVLNCFEITNSRDLQVEYRLVDVEGPFDPKLGDGDTAERNIQQLRKRIAYEEKIPVALHRSGLAPVLAVPASHALEKMEYDLAPDVATLFPRDSTDSLCLGSLSKETERIGLSFLGYHLRSPLRVDGRLWAAGPWTYFRKRPLNYKNDEREVDVYGGFGFRLGVRNGNLCLWVKLTHRYAESDWMPAVYSEHEMREVLRMRHALYHYGNQWYPVQLLGVTGNSIEEQRFIPNGEDSPISVYNYTKQKVGGKKAVAWIEFLDQKSPAIAYRYPGNEQKRYGAAALCKVMLPTEDVRVSRLHHFSIKAPDKRFDQIGRTVETFLQNTTFEGQQVKVSYAPVRVRRRVFRVPAQEFGQGQMLNVGRDTSAGEARLQDLGQKRLELLLDPQGGVAVSTPLDAQYLLVPESQERLIVEDFQMRMEKTTRGLLHRNFSFTRLLYPDRDARTLKQQVEAITGAIDRAGLGSGRGVLMLPPGADRDLHNFLKKKLRDRLQFQCVAAERVTAFYEAKSQNGQLGYAVRADLSNRYVSYLRYTAMGLLLVNRQWPWVLSNNTHYDMYIGVDVLHNTAAFTFFSEGGRHCYIYSVESQQKEKLLRKQVRTIVYDNLKRDLQDGQKPPQSIIMHRDGRAFICEWLGFRDAIEKLINEGLLPKNVVFGVVEIHKTSAEGVRLVEELDDGSLRNPNIGAWDVIDG